MSEIRNKMTNIYLGFIFIILPILYHNRYADIRDYKIAVFDRAVLIFGALMIASYVITVISDVIHHGFHHMISKCTKKLRSWNIADTFVALFALIVLVSSLHSRFGRHAFTGDLGFRIGGFLLLTLCFLYFLISRQHFDFPLSRCWAPAALFLEVTTILNSLDIDILHMHTASMTISDRLIFVSTIGHINYLGQYFCMFIPFFIIQFFHHDQLWEKIVDGIIVFLGFVSALIVRENCIVLGLFFALFVIWILSLKSVEKNEKFLEMMLLLSLSGFLVDVLNHAIIMKSQQLPLDQVPAFFVNKHLYILLALLAGGLLIFFKYKKEDQKILTVLHVLKKVGLAVFGAGMIAVISYAIYCAVYRLQLPIFNNRINIWRGVFNSFSHMKLSERLIGVGPDCVAPMLDRYAVNQGVMRTTAHNEIMQVLIALGILGLIVYLAMYVLMFIDIIRKHNFQKTALGLALIGYLGVSLVVGPSFLDVVTVCTLITLLRCSAH